MDKLLKKNRSSLKLTGLKCARKSLWSERGSRPKAENTSLFIGCSRLPVELQIISNISKRIECVWIFRWLWIPRRRANLCKASRLTNLVTAKSLADRPLLRRFINQFVQFNSLTGSSERITRISMSFFFTKDESSKLPQLVRAISVSRKHS